MNKAEAFDKLKDQAPATAAFLQDVAATFGKPVAICIRFDDGTRHDSGQFKPAQAFADFGARCPSPLYQRQRRWKRK